MSKKPKINIDFQVNARGQLVKINPFNTDLVKIVDGILHHGTILGDYLTFTFLENTYRL